MVLFHEPDSVSMYARRGKTMDNRAPISGTLDPPRITATATFRFLFLCLFSDPFPPRPLLSRVVLLQTHSARTRALVQWVPLGISRHGRVYPMNIRSRLCPVSRRRGSLLRIGRSSVESIDLASTSGNGREFNGTTVRQRSKRSRGENRRQRSAISVNALRRLEKKGRE